MQRRLVESFPGIRRGKLKPSRVTTFRPEDVKNVREKLKASQVEFAQMIGVSVATLSMGSRDGGCRMVRL